MYVSDQSIVAECQQLNNKIKRTVEAASVDDVIGGVEDVDDSLLAVRLQRRRCALVAA